MHVEVAPTEVAPGRERQVEQRLPAPVIAKEEAVGYVVCPPVTTRHGHPPSDTSRGHDAHRGPEHPERALRVEGDVRNTYAGPVEKAMRVHHRAIQIEHRDPGLFVPHPVPTDGDAMASVVGHARHEVRNPCPRATRPLPHELASPFKDGPRTKGQDPIVTDRERVRGMPEAPLNARRPVPAPDHATQGGLSNGDERVADRGRRQADDRAVAVRRRVTEEQRRRISVGIHAEEDRPAVCGLADGTGQYEPPPVRAWQVDVAGAIGGEPSGRTDRAVSAGPPLSPPDDARFSERTMVAVHCLWRGRTAGNDSLPGARAAQQHRAEEERELRRPVHGVNRGGRVFDG